MKAEINSTALYGSRARKDFDIHSDNDLLVVSDSFENQYGIEKAFNDKGYSCSAYTFRKLEILSDKKALFIQHLKQDATILSDKDGRLQNLLINYSPKDNYDNEIKETVAYFDLLKYIPDTVEGIGWAFDIIAIGLRNYNILQLANHKIYEFSLNNILKNSQGLFNLSNDEVSLLVNTRIVKKNYRDKHYQLIPTKYELNATIEIIEKRYSIRIKPIFLSKDNFNQYAFTSVYSNHQFTAYQKLRLFEALSLIHISEPTRPY